MRRSPLSDNKTVITLPNNWTPRPYQRKVWDYLENGGKRACIIWPRRHGKDDLALHWTACAAMQRVGVYWHCLPQANQSRRAIWDAVNENTGIRRIDEAFPDSICEVKRSQDMHIRFINGSVWTLVGSDNYDSLVGSPPVGLVFSEFALADPAAWGYLRPIVANNDGWAMFITTPRGRNHASKLYDYAQLHPDQWFSELLTAKDTNLLTEAQLDRELEEYIASFGEETGTSLFRQEYMCSFDTAVVGSYYGALLDKAEDDGRITNVQYDPALPVTTAWDLGIGDATGIWFFQMVGSEIRVIDYYEASGEGLSYYAKYLNSLPYVYDQHIMPHDIRVRELGTGKSRYEQGLQLGIKPIHIARSLPIDDGINATRSILPRCWFDKRKCSQGLTHLKEYRKEYDEKRGEYKSKPRHDASSHAADSFRYYAVGYEKKHVPIPVKGIMEKYIQPFAW
jgi:phage terminase large subunit